MKKFITMLMLTGAALMAQSGNAPATSPSSKAPADKAAPKVTRKHHKTKKTATTTTPAANAVSNTSAAPAKK